MNFEDEDKFILSKSNIVMIIITSILFILTIIMSVFLYKSLSNEVKSLPDLETTQGRTSTVSSRTTTILTTTTTTTKFVPTSSPYYIINVDDILNDEILLKKDITKEDAISISSIMFEFLNKFYNISDDSLFDISSVIKNSKDNELDKCVYKNNNYGEIYNAKEIIDKAYIKSRQFQIYGYKYNGAVVIYENNKKYYRLENSIDKVDLILASVTVEKYSSEKITANIRYYLSNYKEEGYTSPVYKSVSLELMYDSNRWKTYNYDFPLYK